MRSLLLLSLLLAPHAPARLIEVANDQALRSALAELAAGDTLRIAPGRYQGGYLATNLQGTAEHPILIEGAPGEAPLVEKGKTGFHFVNCTHLTLRHLKITGQSLGGLNIDDGGDANTPAHHILLEDLHLSEIGSGGNHDAIKLSGVDDFAVRGCTMHGWDGQAIDMVGCHRGIIERCTFRGADGRRQTSGPQTKGGSAGITIRHCRFENAGERPLNLGGSTGLPYFRPKGASYEARDISAHDNLFVGGLCAVAFTGLDGGSFHHNTIVRPSKWVFRVLQETTAPGFPPCRNVDFHHNLIVFERRQVSVAANVGAGTDPASFSFHHNLWYAPDAPSRSKPTLPAPETSGPYDLDPQLDPISQRPTAPGAMPYGWRKPSP